MVLYRQKTGKERRFFQQEGMDLIIAVCIDGRNGILFNQRRQSQDLAQREDLLAY